MTACPSCDRAVKSEADACPFCGGPMRDRVSVRLKTPDEEPPVAPVYGMPPIDGARSLPPLPRTRPPAWVLLVMIAAVSVGFLIARALAV